MRSTRFLRAQGLALAVVIAITAGLSSCAVNPVTGERQLALISEQQEIAMGKQYHPEILREMPPYENEALQRYVEGIGQRLAKSSHRPELPWTFTVVDSAAINAFAVPGGFIYITRGLMGYLNTEAELAGVLGHEIGHVTARHSVAQMSRQQLGQIGLVAGMIFLPGTQPYADLAATGLGVLFLKYGRDDERQADRLGAEYAATGGYDPAGVTGMLTALARLSEGEGASRGVPGWLSTHPEPASRVAEVQPAIEELRAEHGTDLARDRSAYLQRIDGIMVGENPREGVIRENAFLHPDLLFQLEFPRGWAIQNTPRQVIAAEPNRRAFLILELAGQAGQDVEQVARQSMAKAQLRQAEGGRTQVNGLNAYVGTWQGTIQNLGEVVVRAAHVAHGKYIYRLAGIVPPATYRQAGPVIDGSLGTFRPLPAAEAARIRPNVLAFHTVRAGDTWQSLAERYPAGDMPPDRLAIFNGYPPDERPRQGERVKVVVEQNR
jgi:predicted Zn-dependent protease